MPHYFEISVKYLVVGMAMSQSNIYVLPTLKQNTHWKCIEIWISSFTGECFKKWIITVLVKTNIVAYCKTMYLFKYILIVTFITVIIQGLFLHIVKYVSGRYLMLDILILSMQHTCIYRTLWLYFRLCPFLVIMWCNG